MSDPHSDGGMSVTIKGDEPGGKFNDPKSPGTWLVFHGSPARIKEQIIEVFNLTVDLDRPLFDIVNEATDLFKASAKVSTTLGGRVLNPGTGAAPSGPAWEQAQSGGSAPSQPAQPEKSEAEIEVERLTAEVAAITSVADLQQLWARNQEAFKNPALMEAYKAKGKALTA